MKTKRTRPVRGEHYYLLIAILLVILLASSVLYCLGFGSVLARQVWENLAPSAGMSEPEVDLLELTPVITPTLSPAITTTLTPLTPTLTAPSP